MKRLFFLICLSLVAGAFIFQRTAEDSGYVLISLAGTSVETSFWTALLILLASLLVLWLVVRLIVGLVRLFTGGAGRLMAVGSRQVQKRTSRGLVEFIEGNWKQAYGHLTRSAPKAEQPLINYLAAARSAYELGDEEEAFQLLHKAEQVAPESGLAVALTQARMLLAARRYEQCMANLERARKIAPKHPVVLDLLSQTYVQLGDWRALQALMPELRKYHIVPEAELAQLEYRLHEALLIKAGDKARLQAPEEGLATVQAEWQSLPGALRKRPELFSIYIEQLVRIGADATVEEQLRKELRRNWSDSLLAVYGRVAGRDLNKQILVAEHWQQERPGNATLLLTLGRLCLRKGEWDRARGYLENSLKLRKDPETCAELARLLAHQGEHEEASHYYQQALQMTDTRLPELPMPAPAAPNAGPLPGRAAGE